MSGPKYDRLGTSDGERSTQVSLDNLAEAGALLEPGLLLVFAAGQPACTVLPLSARATEIGRGHGIFAEFHDATLSRQHAQVAEAVGRLEAGEEPVAVHLRRAGDVVEVGVVGAGTGDFFFLDHRQVLVEAALEGVAVEDDLDAGGLGVAAQAGDARRPDDL